MSDTTRRGLLVLFGTSAITLLATAVAWACTLPVGPTTVVEDGSNNFHAVGTVSYTLEAQSKCNDDSPPTSVSKHCTDQDREQETYAGPQGKKESPSSGYDFGIVKPELVDLPGRRLPRPTCHYATEHSSGAGVSNEFVVHDEARSTADPEAGGQVLTAHVPDDPTAQPSETVACFTSEEENNNLDGGATATIPQPVVYGT